MRLSYSIQITEIQKPEIKLSILPDIYILAR